MTGFGRGEQTSESYSVTVEIKTVNNRFRDIRFKMGSIFNSMELPLKKKIEKKFKRGTFDIYVNYKKSPQAQKAFELDFQKIENYIQEINNVASKAGATVSVNPTEFLKSDFYIEDESREQELQILLEKAFEGALGELESSRVEEGQKLVTILKDHLSKYLDHFTAVEKLKGSYQDQVRERLQKRFKSETTVVEVEEARFLQEVIFYLEKLDIDEEINRIKSHVTKLDSILESKSEIGRQIDFLVQELGRETNTIGSKSGKDEISESVVQMKVQLEKIREQGLNLE